MTTHSGHPGASALVGLTALLLLLGSPLGAADSVAVRAAAFVVARWDTAAVLIGSTVYVYQGYAPPSESADAFSYAPSSDTLTQLSAVYPGNRQGASAATDGTRAWTFGGEALADYKKDIIQHDPSGQGSFTTLTPQLVTGRAWTAAAWASGAAYVLGGELSDGTILDDVVRFDPGANTLAVVGHLGTGVKGASAVAIGPSIYLFGGVRPSGDRVDDIIRYDVNSNTATVMAARLPSARDGTSAAYDGAGYVYVFGGCETNACDLRQVVRYDPATDQVKAMAAQLPTGRGRTSAVWTGGFAYLFGGQQSASVALTQVLKYTPNPPNVAPTADFEATSSGLRLDVNGAASSDPEGNLVAYEWDWGDGLEKGSGANTTHTYASGGSKTVRLTVTDGEGDVGVASVTITLASSSAGAGGSGGSSGGSIIVWYPSPQSTNPTKASKNATHAASSTPTTSFERVDPLSPKATSPVPSLAVFGAAVIAAFVWMRRRHA